MNADPAPLADSIRAAGYAIWPQFVAGDLLDQLTDATNRLLASEHAKPYPKSTRAWDLYLHGGAFVDIVCEPRLATLLDTLLGPHHLLSDLSLNSVNPNQPVDDWHIDYPYTEMHTKIGGAILGVQCVLPLSPFTAATGATHLLPGTHHEPRSPQPDVTGVPVRLIAEPGTLLIMAAATWHRSGFNASQHRRDAILLSFVERWIKPMSAPAPHDTNAIPPRLSSLLGLQRPEETINGVPL
jgi:ectoine hydroxylase-related dioxygenase (phytanoyl-CoA dioxygenase family)